MIKNLHVIIAILAGLLFSACSETSEPDTFPETLRASDWCTEPNEEGIMYVYRFTDRTSGYKLLCYGNGRMIDEWNFEWKWEGGHSQLTLFIEVTGPKEELTVTQHDESGILFTDGTKWSPYNCESSIISLEEGDPIPEELFKHPEWYDFEEVTQFVWKEDKWMKQDAAFVHKNNKLMALCNESNIRSCKYEYEK